MSTPAVTDFSIPSTGGTTFTLSGCRGNRVVLYFYPKDSTPGCTTEAQQFRDLHAQFVESGCLVVGISRDSLRSHENFKSRQELPFELLADTEEKLCTQFSVIKEKKLYGKLVRGVERSTFLIDEEGRLVKEWRGIKAPGHALDVLTCVRAL